MEWFIARNGKPVGPLTFDALVDAARRGQLNQEDYVWQPGADTWERADSVPRLWELWDTPAPQSALVRKMRRHWLGIAILGLVVVVALAATTFSTIQSWGDSDYPRPIKRDCAFNDYLRGRC